MARRLTLSKIAIAVIATSVAAQAEDFWINEAYQGCEIWSDRAPVEGDVLTWTGDCMEGKADGVGVLLWTRDGALHARYDGEMAAGKLDGRGLLIETSEAGARLDVIDGEFRQGLHHGEMIIRAADGTLFIGTFSNGIPDGPARWVDANGNSFDGFFKDGVVEGPARTISVEGEIYTGEFTAGERHGTGTLRLTDGGAYVGQFEQGMMSGLGMFDGDAGTYEGQFSNNNPNGAGSFSTAEGVLLQGRFHEGSPDGRILVTLPDGTQGVETWENGEKIQ